MTALEFPPFQLPPDAETLRTEVRAFLKEVLPTVKGGNRYESWLSFSPEFSRELGARGWIGITWPKKYGGGEKSVLHRYVITEELLANGAPAGSHWAADRQSGPSILHFGTEEIKQSILPRIVRGECYFTICMSEPDAGSDLASAKSTAVGWSMAPRAGQAEPTVLTTQLLCCARQTRMRTDIRASARW
jgi:acyl-CoA dehydrogenase